MRFLIYPISASSCARRLISMTTSLVSPTFLLTNQLIQIHSQALWVYQDKNSAESYHQLTIELKNDLIMQLLDCTSFDNYCVSEN